LPAKVRRKNHLWKHGKDGLLVDYGQFKNCWPPTIMELLKDKGRCKAMGDAAEKKALSRPHPGKLR